MADGPSAMVRLKGITKTFPGVIACENVDLDARAGEIHALLGENGAGKSTLMNVLTGIYRPDAGDILIDAARTQFAAPADAIAAGIGMVHQHFKLVPSFTVAENIHLGWARTPGLLRSRDLARRTRELAQGLKVEVHPDARVDDLSTGEQQRVEILRVLSRHARLLILDEPTAVLTPAEARDLFGILKIFVARGNAVILISHKLDEVLEVADRITVLRGGRRVATAMTRDCSAGMLARLMVGHDIARSALRTRSGSAPSASVPVLALRDVVVTDAVGTIRLDGVCLELRGGEILGVAGVAGNGQKELSQVLTGMRRVSSGDILLGGEDYSRRSARDFADFGIGHIPEDRLHSGLAPALSITDNSVMREYRRPPVALGPWYRPRRALTLAHSIAGAASVRVADLSMPAANLSGGNQQRLVARREMRIATRVLVAAYPSRGLDVGAIDAIMRHLAGLRDAGVGVILISEELEELVNLCDRIAVLCRGAITGCVDPGTASLEEIGLLMAGQRTTVPRPPDSRG